MCGRYANHVGAMHGWTDILTDWPTDAKLGFNIAPTQMIPAFLPAGGQAMRWGLIPNWLDQPSSKYSTFNARLATASEKPTFRHAWKNGQRCLIPALGYYEWRQEEDGKQAYFVHRADQHPLVFAGLYEPAREQVPASCTVLTRPAKGNLEPLHHAMPVMLNPEHALAWFHDSAANAEEIAWRDYGEEFSYYPISNAVNKVANQGGQLIQPRQKDDSTQHGFDF